MTLADKIQLAMLAVLAFTVVLIALQTRTQNHMLKAQVSRDRFETFWQTVRSSVSQDDLKTFYSLRDDYIDLPIFKESYEGNEEKIRRYMKLLNLYDYLAFMHSQQKLHLPDPLKEFATLWTKDLLVHPEFLDVHKCHREYYPEFAAFLDGICKQQGEKTSEPPSSQAA